MIEMRWVERDPQEGFGRMPGIRNDLGMNLILQYRSEVGKNVWSEWQDVPISAENLEGARWRR